MNDLKKIAYIALGANLSNPKDNFQGAVKALELEGMDILAASSLWHSPAWPAGQGHPDYVNAVVKVQTQSSAQDLLENLHEIEFAAGRKRTVLNAPRPLDLDIIDYASDICETSPLLPHPRLLDRPFVLLPLWEVCEVWRHPVTGSSVMQGLAELPLDDVMEHYVIDRKWLKSLSCV